MSKKVLVKTTNLILDELPEWVHWLALDNSGMVVGYENKPHSYPPCKMWDVYNGRLLMLANNINGNWADSLTEVCSIEK